MAVSPIITRLYGPEAFGVMGVFNTLINIIVPVSALTYPLAIVLPKSNEDAKGLIYLSLIVTGFVTTLSLLILLFIGNQIVNVFNLQEASIFLYLIPLVVIFSGLMQVIRQWLIRTKQFSINARATFYQSLLINGGKVGIGFFYPFSSVLVLLTALGNGLRSMLMIILIKKSTYKYSKKPKKKTRYDLKGLARRYYDFPIYRAPESFINAVSQGLPVLLLTVFFGPAAAGFYTIGWTVLSLPTRLIGEAIGDVFYPRVAEASNNKENVGTIIKKATLLLGGVGIIPYGLVVLFGPFLFSFVFGDDWVVAGEYARWIALLGFTNFINKPSIRSLAVLNAQRFHLIFTIIMLITRITLLVIGVYIFSSDVVAIALFGISGAILNIGLIIITLKISRKRYDSI